MTQAPDPGREVLLHGTSVALAGRAALLRGAPGAGKSDLALRFIAASWPAEARLVADDQTRVWRHGAGLRVAAPETLAGRLEVRGVGIVPIAHCGEAPLVLLVDLVAAEAVSRLPQDPLPRDSILGVSLPRLALFAFEPSAPAKLGVALAAAAA